MKCKSCNAQIRWIRTVAGKQMPVEEEPIYYLQGQGPYTTFLSPQGAVERGVQCKRSDDGARLGFVPHWANCPGAKRHRRRRRK